MIEFQIALKGGPLSGAIVTVEMDRLYPGRQFRVYGHVYELLNTPILAAVIKSGKGHPNLAAGAQFVG